MVVKVKREGSLQSREGRVGSVTCQRSQRGKQYGKESCFERKLGLEYGKKHETTLPEVQVRLK